MGWLKIWKCSSSINNLVKTSLKYGAMPWHTRYLYFVLQQANLFATWLSRNIELKSSDLLSQERNECFAMATSRTRIICLELLLGRFSVWPAANAVFSVELWKTLLMFQTFSMCVQGFSSMTCYWKWFWADFVPCWVNVCIFLKTKFILIIS